jgi:hypothetical protein
MAARPRDTAHTAFDALSVEGGLITPAWLHRVAQLQAGQQAEGDYGIPKGLQLRDEIGRYWRIAQAMWREFAHGRVAGAAPDAVAQRFVTGLLRDAFGFVTLQATSPKVILERSYPIGHEALGGRVPVVVVPAGHDLDKPAVAFGDGGRRRSPFGLLQEYLNATETTLWGVVSDGTRLRLARDNGSLTRPAWIEADLSRIFTEALFADFTALWLLLHESRFGAAPALPAECALEAWRAAGREEGTRARDTLRRGVEDALRVLGQGFLAHPENRTLRERLQAGTLTKEAYFQQLLRLVYRLIFLLTVEERGVLHPRDAAEDAIALYAEGYSVRRVRDRALRRAAHDRHGDLWQALTLTWRGVATGEPRLALPALGGLFEDAQCPDLDASGLENRALLHAMFRLGYLRDDAGLSRVNWRDMGPEELGSVYESLLELVPVVADGARSFDFAAGGETRGNARKLTGSYYTPDGLVQMLLDSALEPVVAEAVASHPEAPAEALLRLTVVDPACGSGHFLLGAARRLAGHLARLRVDGTPTATDYRQALRDVVSRCIYGVDRNPMAIELARTALWLEAMTPEAPLTFLDHHLVVGDALVGVLDPAMVKEGIPNEAFKTLAGDDPEVCKRLAKANREGLKVLKAYPGQGRLEGHNPAWVEALRQLDAMPDDTLEAHHAKQARRRELFAALQDEQQHPEALLADLYVSAFLAPKTAQTEAFVATTSELRAGGLQGLGLRNGVAAFAREVAGRLPVLHWPITFAHVFERGGFDVVLGNPPWERIKLQEQEFFASRDPAIATAPNAAERRKRIAALAAAPPDSAEHRLYTAFLDAKHEADAGSVFVHDGGRYPLTGTGDVNTYALFAETALHLLAPHGRAGIVVPSGIATDDGTKAFFGHISDGRLVSLIDFENRDAIFPGVHRSYKFCLLTLGRAERATFAFFLSQPAQATDERRRFSLSGADIARLNPNTRTCAVFRSQADAELTKRIYERVPVLWDETRPDGNPWGISFTRLFDMSNDSNLFRTAAQLAAEGHRREGPDWVDAAGTRYVPLYEAKMIHQFDHRWATYAGEAEDGARDVTDAEKADPDFTITPRYWVPQTEVERRLGEKGWDEDWLMGWRDICRSTDERTVIATVLPKAGCGDTLLLMFPGVQRKDLSACLLADQCSLVHDFIARQKIGGTHLKYHYKKQITNLPPAAYREADIRFISSRVGALLARSRHVQSFVDGVGETGPINSEQDAVIMRAELDAYYAALYGLTRDDLRYILDPTDVMGADYPSETFRVLKDKELRRHGSFLTRHLVLEAWDRLAASGELPRPAAEVGVG